MAFSRLAFLDTAVGVAKAAALAEFCLVAGGVGFQFFLACACLNALRAYTRIQPTIKRNSQLACLCSHPKFFCNSCNMKSSLI